MDNIINKGIIYCVEKHGKQGYRKLEKVPYVMHPLEVSTIIVSMTDNEDVIVAGLLHDVVEDTDTTLEEIKREFGDYIATLVESETEDKMKEKSPKETWLHRKKLSIEKLSKEQDINVKILWLSDKLSNIRSIKRSYEKIGDDLFNYFNNHNKEEHKWYYFQVLDLTKELSNFDAWKEFKEDLNFIFGGYNG